LPLALTILLYLAVKPRIAKLSWRQRERHAAELCDPCSAQLVEPGSQRSAIEIIRE
jgi:hypothetical protein